MTPSLLAMLALGLALAAGPHFEGARRPLRRVTAPSGLGTLSAEACGACHATIYQQWLGSRHAAAYRNRLFQVSYQREPKAWCRNCHAPLGAQVVLAEGVSCAACHVRDRAVLGPRPPSAAALLAHPVKVAPLLSQSELCGACHQFNFPRHGEPLRYSDQPMQDTLAEWRSAGSRERCQDCHMGAAGHRMPGAHDPEYLRRSITAEVTELADRRVRLTLRSRGAGHRVPTGDPFRRLRLDLCADLACAQVLETVTFGRRFRRTREAWALVQDRTIPTPGPSGEALQQLELALAERPRGFRLSYSYAAASTEAALRPEERSLELQRGPVLQPERPAP